MNRRPRVGEIVEFQAFGTPDKTIPGTSCAALVRRVHENGKLDLEVFGYTTMFNVEYDENRGCDTWHWPTK